MQRVAGCVTMPVCHITFRPNIVTTSVAPYLLHTQARAGIDKTQLIRLWFGVLSPISKVAITAFKVNGPPLVGPLSESFGRLSPVSTMRGAYGFLISSHLIPDSHLWDFSVQHENLIGGVGCLQDSPSYLRSIEDQEAPLSWQMN